ncbi:MAG TPA: LamG domain-containing protein [Hyphomicrobiaceae bacterium]|nr:LamG domain-containing protein [Hyphomicrobiaceae bacterium]
MMPFAAARLRKSAGASGDPYFANVVLLLHADGSNGSTTFTDSSSYARTITGLGNAQISTAQSVFGGSSIYLDGSGDALSVPHAASLEAGWQDFCFEARVRLDDLASYYALFSKRATDSGSSGEWQAFFNLLTGGWTMGFNTAGTSYPGADSSVSAAANTWAALCIERSGTTARMMVNGAVVATATVTGALLTSAANLIIGAAGNDLGAPWKGYIDELRYTIGAARYGGAYTVASAPFPDF